MLLYLPMLFLSAYAPPGMGLDPWFIKDGDTWHQFQLCGPYPEDIGKVWAELPPDQAGRKPSTHVEQGIYHSTSRDLVTWRDEGVVLTLGAPGQWDDGAIYTGNIAKHDGVYYLFYTGLPAEPQPGQQPSLIGVATSTDLKQWTKHPDNPILYPDPRYYEPMGNWRDCSFYWDATEKVWYAVICGTALGDGPMEARCCIALMQSPDMIHWTGLPPIVTANQYKLGLENPFLFTRGGRWYTGHSMYSQFYDTEWLAAHPGVKPTGGLFYFMSNALRGPYTAPEPAGIGLQPDPPLYAVQIIQDGEDRLLLHRGPDRWATALPKKVDFLPDGRMRLAYWPGCEAARKESLLEAPFAPETELLTGKAIVLNAPMMSCFIEAEVHIPEGGAVKMTAGGAYPLVLDGPEGKAYLVDSATGTPRADRASAVDTSKPVRLRIVADGSVVEAYANDIWLFAERRPEPALHQVSLEVVKGERAGLGNLRVDRLDTGNRKDRYGFNY